MVMTKRLNKKLSVRRSISLKSLSFFEVFGQLGVYGVENRASNLLPVKAALAVGKKPLSPVDNDVGIQSLCRDCL